MIKISNLEIAKGKRSEMLSVKVTVSEIDFLKKLSSETCLNVSEIVRSIIGQLKADYDSNNKGD